MSLGLTIFVEPDEKRFEELPNYFQQVPAETEFLQAVEDDDANQILEWMAYLPEGQEMEYQNQPLVAAELEELKRLATEASDSAFTYGKEPFLQDLDEVISFVAMIPAESTVGLGLA